MRSKCFIPRCKTVILCNGSAFKFPTQFLSVVTKTWNDPQRPTTIHNDPLRPHNDPLRPTTTHYDPLRPTTIHNDPLRPHNDPQRPQWVVVGRCGVPVGRCGVVVGS